jgi:hypothetical protein
MGFMHKFAYSFFDFAAYRQFLVQGLGKSILYIFLVTLIFSTITNINTINTFISETTTIQTKFVQSAPNIELKDGVLSVASDKPIYYKHDGEILIVDTSGQTNKSVLDTYSNAIYINSNELVLRQNYKTIESFQFANFPELNVTNQTIQYFLYISKIIIPVMILIFTPLISFLLNLISGFLILGPLSLNIGSLMGVKLKYSTACILSFYSMTLPLLLEALLDISGMTSNEFIIIFYIIALIYCGLAINELKKKDKSNLNYM